MEHVVPVIAWTLVVGVVAVIIRRTKRGSAVAQRAWFLCAVVIISGYLMALNQSGILAVFWVVAVVVGVIRVGRRARARRRQPVVGRVQRMQPEVAGPAREMPLELVEDLAVLRAVEPAWDRACVAVGLAVRDAAASETLREAQRAGRSSAEGLAAVADLARGHQLRKALREPGLVQEGPAVYCVPRVVATIPTALGPALDVEHVAGLTTEAYEKAAGALAAALRVPAIRVTKTREQQDAGIVRLTIVTRDSLVTPVKVDMTVVPAEAARVPVAMTEAGDEYAIELANTSSMVVGGIGGSGKTAALSAMLSRMIQRPDVQTVVVDGKGGADWDWIAPRASVYTAEDEDLTVAADVIGKVREVMRHRAKTLKAETGSSNFWASGPTRDRPLILLLIDECQTYLDPAEVSDKDSKALVSTITGHLSALVKKGRSAGIVTIVMTQKPTSDALPTRIRDNAQLATCFHVRTPEAVAATLGTREVDPSPVAIPLSMPGTAVVHANADADQMTSGSSFQRVRFHYIAEDDAAQIAQSTAHLRRPLSQMLPEPESEPVGAVWFDED